MMDNIVCCYLYAITKYGYPPPAADTLKYIEEMSNLGFSLIELEGIHEQHLMDVYNMRDKIKNKLDALNMHVPYFCAVLPGLSSYEVNERNANVKLFEIGCKTASYLGANGLLDNAPIPPYQFPAEIPVTRHYDEDVIMKAQFPSEMEWSAYWNGLIVTFRELCDMAADYGLTYQIHPSIGTLSATTEGFLHFYQAVERKNLKFTLDTANQFLMKDNLSLALLRLKDHLDYIHISDNRGEKLEHLGLGQGNIRWDDFFQTLKRINFSGYFGLDIGGDESAVEDLDGAYIAAREWLATEWGGE
jgi:sugar phosphate isomerase/epimerase